MASSSGGTALLKLHVVPASPQMVGDRPLRRECHVWYRVEGGLYKCVICGGITDRPTVNDAPDKGVRQLTDAERLMCPPERDLRRGG